MKQSIKVSVQSLWPSNNCGSGSSSSFGSNCKGHDGCTTINQILSFTSGYLHDQGDWHISQPLDKLKKFHAFVIMAFTWNIKVAWIFEQLLEH